MLHQVAGLAAAADPNYDPQTRAAELRGEAERSLRMARVLAAGGFPEEALPLIAKAIGIGAAARLAALGELAAGVSIATPAQIRDLVDRGVFASQAQAALSVLWSLPAGVASATLYRSSITRRLWWPGSLTETGGRPHEMKVGRGRNRGKGAASNRASRDRRYRRHSGLRTGV